jgi:hypothetical protein
MKTYIISKKKTKKNELKTSNAFLSVKMIFFAPKMMIIAIAVNHVDFVTNFLWPRNTPQLEFPNKIMDV